MGSRFKVKGNGLISFLSLNTELIPALPNSKEEA